MAVPLKHLLDISPTTVGAWQTITATAIGAPANISGVMVAIVNTSTVSKYKGHTRPNGSTDTLDASLEKEHITYSITAVDSDKKFQIYAEDLSITMHVVCWFTDAEFIGFINEIELINPARDVWQTIDFSVIPTTATPLAFVGNNHFTQQNVKSVLRPVGSQTDLDDDWNLTQSASGLGSTVVLLNTKQQFQWYMNTDSYGYNAKNSLFARGYFIANINGISDPDVYGVSVKDTWGSVDISATVPQSANFVLCAADTGPSGDKLGLRPVGDTASVYNMTANVYPGAGLTADKKVDLRVRYDNTTGLMVWNWMTAPTTDHLINNNNAIVTTVLTNASPVVLYAADASYSAQNNRVKILQGEGSLTASVTAESADSIGISAVDIHASSLAYGDVDIVISGDGGNTWGNAYAATAIPVPTSDYVTGAGVITDNTALFWAIPGAADGWQIEYPGTLSDGSTLTVSADGTFVRADPVDPSITFALWVYDPAAKIWDTQQVTIRDGEVIQQPVFTGPIPDQSDPEDTLIQALDLSAYFSGTIDSYSVDHLPEGLGLDAATGIISGTAPAPEVITVTATATNGAGSADSDPFSWAILDATAPVVIPPADVSFEFPHGAAGLPQADPGLLSWMADSKATEETAPVNPEISNDLSTLGDPIVAGVYTVVFSATDNAGNTGEATSQLTIAEAAAEPAPEPQQGHSMPLRYPGATYRQRDTEWVRIQVRQEEAGDR